MAESKSEMQARLEEFIAQLLYAPQRSIVVVGHSHFFREVFRHFLSEEVKAEEPKLTASLSKKKLMNCGVARLELDPGKGVAGGPIVGVQLVLDTTMDSDGGVLAACCAAPGAEAEETFTEEATHYEAFVDTGTKGKEL